MTSETIATTIMIISIMQQFPFNSKDSVGNILFLHSLPLATNVWQVLTIVDNTSRVVYTVGKFNILYKDIEYTTKVYIPTFSEDNLRGTVMEASHWVPVLQAEHPSAYLHYIVIH